MKKEGWTRPQETLAKLPVPATDFEGLDLKQQAVIEAFALGASTMEEAAARGCVSVATIYRWKADEKFKKLCDAARLRARDQLVNNIKKFGELEWRPNAWLLEKLYKSEFGQAAVLQGNTFNILGSINLGIERAPIEGEAVDVSETTPTLGMGQV
jgi:hypothetical protein